MAVPTALPETQPGTYRSAGFPAVDFDEFHRVELPRRLREGKSDEIAWDVEGVAPLGIQLADRESAYSFVSRDGAIEVVAGIVDDAATVLEIIDHESWIDYLHEFRTRTGLLYSQAVQFLRGDFDSWDAWDPAIRCMYSGREIYNPSALDFRDLEGRPLDLTRRFDLSDSADEMSHFLRTTGYLVVRRAFDPEFLAQLSDEVDRIASEAVEGELTSWWAENPDGRRFPYRLTYLSDKSKVIDGLYTHPRVTELIALAKEDVRPVPDRIEGILAVIKASGLEAGATGFANLPFHSDCGFGACHLTCPCVLVGVQLDAMSERSSQLRMMAGTHGKSVHNRARDHERYPIVTLETEPGDATVHYGCGLHAGPAPTGPEPRRTLYVQHYGPGTFDLIGPYQGYNQIMPGYGKGEILNIEEMKQHDSSG
ncbi:MAG: phytanoyl-CoA dioxygenase family protein [Myxococcota bacterium]|nr:phytanoyl-CoA dioxygenase family protein [Myxococcota bacterium]